MEPQAFWEASMLAPWLQDKSFSSEPFNPLWRRPFNPLTAVWIKPCITLHWKHSTSTLEWHCNQGVFNLSFCGNPPLGSVRGFTFWVCGWNLLQLSFEIGATECNSSTFSCYWLLCRTIGSKILICGWNPYMWRFKWMDQGCCLIVLYKLLLNFASGNDIHSNVTRLPSLV